jgi:hypothetical protein
VKGKVAGVRDRLTGKKADDRTPDQKKAAVDSAITEVEGLMHKPGSTRSKVSAALGGIKSRYQLTQLRLVDSSAAGKYHAHAELNPMKNSADADSDVMTVEQAVKALRSGKTEATVKTRDEAIRVVHTVYPDALERPGAGVGSAYGSGDMARAIASFREDRKRLVLYHIDADRYRVAEILPALDREIARKKQAVQAAVDAQMHITVDIQDRQARSGRAEPGVRKDSTRRLAALDERIATLQGHVRALEESKRGFSRRLPDYEKYEREGVLYGHETVKPEDHPHRKNPHINVEGTRVTVEAGVTTRESIEATVYFKG